ncbi:MAG: menaquinone biosynthesis decarboxylase [Actinomycetota bacterium]|nr:menaquinone biosynthesis decarboxylase [Actinomycetota bacterium]
MAFKDLREFIKFLEERGELKRVSATVDPILEMTEIVDRISKASGPAVLFEKAKGSKMPVLMNAFGTTARMAWALGVDNLDEVGERVRKLTSFGSPTGAGEKLGALLKLKDLAGYGPKLVKKAPCQEVVISGNPSLNDLPILKCWPGDGGRFITLPLVITKNPLDQKQNMGMYRMQVFDERTTGMHIHLHHDGAENYRKSEKMGEPMEVAVALGGDPATIYAATAPLPKGLDELIFAGFLRKKPVEVVKARTVDLLVPAQAEIILEGHIDPIKRQREGPFGDHTGYYSLEGDYPVFNLTCITRRKDAIYSATVVGKPPMEDCYMGKATERIFLPLLQLVYPEIVDMDLPLEGVFHNCAIIGVKKSYPMHAAKVMNGIWSMGQMMLTKMIVVVDEDIDVHNYSEVAWKVFNNVDPARDIIITRGPLDALDHSSPTANFGSKMGIDATRKWKEEGHDREWPDDIVMNEEIKRLVSSRWKEYGFK